MTPPDIKDIEAITKLVDKDGYDPEIFEDINLLVYCVDSSTSNCIILI